jgi:C-8 sterol isomerase
MGYVFDPDELHRISKLGVGRPFDEMVRAVTDELVKVYPEHIDPDPRWVYSLAGGATGVMGILHGSLSEYVIIFGSPVGTEGFSGRYHIDIHDYVMAGEMWTYTESRYGERVITKAGERAVLRKGNVKGFRISEECWMLEYGLGPVPTCLPMGLGDAVFSGQDFPTIARTLLAYGGLTIKELLQGKI